MTENPAEELRKKTRILSKQTGGLRLRMNKEKRKQNVQGIKKKLI